MMKIESVTDRQKWEDYVSHYSPNTFLQSWAWGEIQERFGKKTFRLGVIKDDQLIGVCLASLVHAKKGTFLYAQHGPLIDWDDQDLVTLMMDALQTHAKEQGALFVRITPLLTDSTRSQGLLRGFGYRPAAVHGIDTRRTLLIDLRQSQEKLLADMRKSTRYEVRRAEKEGVTVSHTIEDDMSVFLPLYQQMVERQQFIPYPEKRFHIESEIFSNAGQLHVFTSSYQGTPYSAAIVVVHGGTAFYNHGASVLIPNAKVSTAHILQWEIMKWAKEQGLHTYNMWGGVVEEEAPKDHPWYGISAFKRGFGGVERVYVPVFDLPLSPLYFLTYGVEYLRRKKMHL